MENIKPKFGSRYLYYNMLPSLPAKAVSLLNQAKILEGEEVADHSAFSRRLNDLMKRSLAA